MRVSRRSLRFLVPRLAHLSLPALLFACSGSPPSSEVDADRADSAVPPGDDAGNEDGDAGGEAGATDGGSRDAGRRDGGPPVDAGPRAPSVLFADDFDSHDPLDFSGRCTGPTDTRCADATFPWERSSHTPGWTFLWSGGGSEGSYPYVAQLTSVGARGGSGMNVQMWDENEHELGRSQWGHDFQLAKYWYPEQHPEIWLQMWVYWTSPVIRTTNQKMTHIFHYDRSWLDAGRSFFSTADSTDGGVICNWRQEAGNMEFRCSPRCSNPSDYRCSDRRRGVYFASPDGAAWSGQVPRFEMRTGAACTVPADRSYEAVFADGNWHKFEVGVRMNSAPGVSDGELELWFDDCRLGLVRGIPFREAGADADVLGFNAVSFGGNAQPNDWGPDNTDAETWQVDDLQICSERCP